MKSWLISLTLLGIVVFVGINAWYIQTLSENGMKDSVDGGETIQIKLLANQSWMNRDFLERAINEYEQYSGNTIDVQVVPSNSADSIIKKKFAVDVLSDLVLFYGGQQLEALQPTKNFYAFDDEDWINNLEPYILPQITNNFKVYGFPLWEGALSGIIYNKSLFEKYNLEVPYSKEQFFAVCEALKQHGIKPLYMGFRDIWPISPQFGMDVIAERYPDFVKRLNRNQLKLTDFPEMIEVASWYDRLAREGYLGDQFTTNNWDGQADALALGEYAMAIGTDTYLYSELEVRYPGSASRFGLIPFYFGFNEGGNYVRNETVSIYVNQNGRQAKAALDFIRFASDPKRLNEWYRGVYTQPLFKSIDTHKLTPQFIEVKNGDTKAPILSSSASLLVGYSSVEMAAPLQELMLGQLTPEEAVRKMDQVRIDNAQNQRTPGF